MSKKKKILVVDDDESLRKILCDSLSSYDYDVTSAADGAEALKMLSESEFDVVFTDLNIPNLNGIDLVKNAKARGHKADFIILTGYGTTFSSIRAKEAGAVDYISKPIDIFQLRELADRLTGRVDESKEETKQDLETKVLIADPEPGFITGVRNILEKQGLIVDETKTAADSKLKLQTGQYDVAIVDLQMIEDGVPKDGVIVSGFIDQNNINRFLEVSGEEGVFGIVNKSTQPYREFKESLVETVENAVKKRRADDVAWRVMGEAAGKPDLRKRIQDEQYHSAHGSGGRRKEEIIQAEAIRRALAKKILIVNEDDKNRVELENRLRANYNIITANDFNSAVKLVSSEADLELVILNASSKGYAIADQIRDRYPNVSLLLGTDNEKSLSHETSNLRAKEITGYELVKWSIDSLEDMVKLIFINRKRDEFIREMRSSSDVRRELLERQITEDPSNIQRHYELAQICKQEGDLEKARAEYEKVLEFDENHLDALYGIIDVLEQLEEEGPTHIEEAEKYSWMWILDRLMRKSSDPRTHLGLIKVSARKGDNDKVIKYCSKLIENEQGSVEVYARLCVAYIRKRDKKKAGETLDAILSFPKNEFYIGLQQHEIEDEELEPGLVLEDISQHRVYRIVPRRITGPNIIIKSYESGNRSAAKNDFKNLAHLSRNNQKLEGKCDVPRPILLREKKDRSLLVAERIEGIRADRAYLTSISEEERLSYLARLTDATVALALLGNDVEDRQDVRAFKNKLKIKGEDIEVGYYTARFDSKFIRQFEVYAGKKISDDDRKTLLELHVDINSELSSAPDFLYLFYTDCNFRNFSIIKKAVSADAADANQIERVMAETVESTDPSKRLESIREAKIYGYDKESDLKNLFLLDLMSLLEHEIVGKDMKSKRNSDYLIQRALLGLIRPSFGEEQDVLEEIDAALSSYEKRKVKAAFEKYFPQFTGEKYSWEKLKTLAAASSIQRHLTILGDKERDLYKLQKARDKLRTEHDIVRLYERTLTEGTVQDKDGFAKELESRLKTAEGINETEKKALRSYMLLGQVYDEILMYKQIHLSSLRAKLNETGRKEFKAKLEKLYFKK